MSNTIAVSLAQIDVSPLDRVANEDKILDIARAEAAAGSDLILFPELCNTGYVEPLIPGQPFQSDRQHADYAARLHAASCPLDGPLIARLSEVAKRHGSHIVVGLSLRHSTLPGVLQNTSVLIGPGGPLCVYAKAHLWHNEKLYFMPGSHFPVSHTTAGRIGMQVCYDIRFPEVTRLLALAGAEIVTNVWASFRAEDKPVADPDLFRHRAFTRAQENGVYFLSCNRAGSQQGCRFMGRSVIASPDGSILAALDHEDEGILKAELDLDEVIRYRMSVGLLSDRRPDLYGALGQNAADASVLPPRTATKP